jgi:hypothetical protein
MVLPVLSKQSPQSTIIKQDTVNPVLNKVISGLAIYRLTYSFNPKLADALKATSLTISVSTELGNNNRKPQIIKGSSAETMVDNILQQVNIYQNLSYARNNYAFSVRRDIRKYYSVSDIKNNDLYTRVFVSENVGAMNALNQNANTNNLNINANLLQNIAPSKFNLRKQLNNLRYTQKIDPASLYIGGTNAIVPLAKTFAGVKPLLNFTQTSLFSQNSRVKNIISSALSKTTINTQGSLPEDTYVTTIKKVATETINVSDKIIIPVSIFGKSDFKLIFELFDNNERRLQRFEVFVSHNTNVNTLFITIPPRINKKNNPGSSGTTMMVEQLDPFAKGISVYRRTLFSQANDTAANYVKIADIPLTSGMDPYTFRDAVQTNNDVIYRFIPYDEDKSLASVFSTILIPNDSRSLPRKVTNRRSFCVLDYSTDVDSLIIKATDVPVEAVAICFYRRNKTINQDKFTRISNIIRVQSNSVLPMRLVDTNVKKYNVYEYKIGIIYLDGIEQMAPQLLTIEFRPIDKNIATANITNIQNTTYGNGIPDVTFTVSYSINSNQAEDLKKLFTDQNLLAEYGQEIINNKQKLQNLFAYKVIRLNKYSNEIEDFGVITDVNFSDRKQGTSKGIKPLVPGIEYKYTITTLLRDPETLYPTIHRTVSKTVKESRKNLNLIKSYEYYPYEWSQPVTFRNGTLYSDTSIIRSYPQTLPSFEFGPVIDIKETSILALEDLPKIINSVVNFIRNRGCLIEWSVSGNHKKVDYFIITRDMSGLKTIVGAAHSMNSTGKYTYLDQLNNDEKGPATYFITPVYYNDMQGAPSQTNRIVI